MGCNLASSVIMAFPGHTHLLLGALNTYIFKRGSETSYETKIYRTVLYIIVFVKVNGVRFHVGKSGYVF